MFGHGTEEGTDFWNIAKVIAVLLILAVIFVGIISIAESFADSANTANPTEETLNLGSAKSETGTGTNVSEAKTEKDIASVRCSSNLKTKILDFKKFDSSSVKSEGVWFTEKPNYAEYVTVVAVIKIENIEKFFLEIDNITLDNLRIVESDHPDYSNIVMDVGILHSYSKMDFSTWMTKGPTRDTETYYSVEGLVVFGDIKNKDLREMEMIYIEIGYYRPPCDPNL